MSSANSSEGVRSRARTQKTRVSSRSASWASTTLPRRLLRSSKRRRLRGLPAAITGSAVCGLVIVFVINFIVSLMAVIRMHHGADEYGPQHAANARRGVLFKWVGTTLSTLAAILVVYLVLAGSSGFLFGGPAPTILYVPLLITIFWTAGVTSKGQMYRFMLRSLQPPETRRWSDIASILIPALGVIGIGVVGSVTARILQLLSNPSSATDPGESSRLFSFL